MKRTAIPIPPSQRARALFLDVHPGHIVAHDGERPGLPFFTCVLQPHTMPAAKVALILAAGLRSVGMVPTVREFDAAGWPLFSAAKHE